MKKLMRILVIIVLALLILAFAKDLLAKMATEAAAQLAVGLKVSMQSFSLGVIQPKVAIKNLEILNPAGYPDKDMAQIPEIYVHYDLPALFKGKVHLKDMRFNLKEFTVVKNAKGEVNLNSLKVAQAQKEGKKPEAKEGQKMPQLQIDQLELTIGKVLYKDYSRGKEPVVREFPVNLHERYSNIDNPYTLVSLIVVKALMNTSIAGLTNFDLSGLKNTVSGTLASAEKVAAQAVETTKKAVEAGAEAVSKTTKEIGETIKLPVLEKK
jgi:hypothetical protein